MTYTKLTAVLGSLSSKSFEPVDSSRFVCVGVLGTCKLMLEQSCSQEVVLNSVE